MEAVPTATRGSGQLRWRLAGLAWLVVAFEAAKALVMDGAGTERAVPGGLVAAAVLGVALGLAWTVGVRGNVWAARAGVVGGLAIAAYGWLAPGVANIGSFGDPRLLILVAGLLIAVLNLAAAIRSEGGGPPRTWPTAKEVEGTRQRLANAVGEEQGPISRQSPHGKEIFHPD